MLQILRTLLNRTSEDSLLQEAQDHLQGMLAEAEQLLRQVHPYLMQFDALVQLREAATAADRRSDEHDRKMRRSLMGHLATRQAATDQALGMFSVGSRAERIVDLVREVVEIAAWVRTPLPKVYMAHLTSAFAEVLDFLVESRQCLVSVDAYQALALLDRLEAFRGQLTEAVVDRVLEDAELTSRQAIVLYRSFHIATRICAQLGNIVAVVALPLESMDFVSQDAIAAARKKLRKEGGTRPIAVPAYSVED
jgi:hypothetical protein